MENKKIEFHCSKCNKRLFDYIAGDMCVEIEMKCERCKRVMRLKKYTELQIRTKSINGKFLV